MREGEHESERWLACATGGWPSSLPGAAQTPPRSAPKSTKPSTQEAHLLPHGAVHVLCPPLQDPQLQKVLVKGVPQGADGHLARREVAGARRDEERQQALYEGGDGMGWEHRLLDSSQSSKPAPPQRRPRNAPPQSSQAGPRAPSSLSLRRTCSGAMSRRCRIVRSARSAYVRLPVSSDRRQNSSWCVPNSASVEALSRTGQGRTGQGRQAGRFVRQQQWCGASRRAGSSSCYAGSPDANGHVAPRRTAGSRWGSWAPASEGR